MMVKLEWELAGETEVLGENLPQFHFVHYKSHIIWHEIESAQLLQEVTGQPPELWNDRPANLL
jgi:hypothetical protein